MRALSWNFAVLLGASWSLNTFGYSLDFSAALGAQGTWFPQKPLYSQQSNWNVSGSFEPKLKIGWERQRAAFDAAAFFRLDKADPSRTHWDLSEFAFVKRWQDYELRAGVRKMFWGVTESQHLVDVVNQLDFVEDPLGDQKLGQPMVSLARIGDGWSLETLVMPYFRTRTFPSESGRFRGPLAVDADAVSFESSAKRYHPDVAARLGSRLGIADFGLSYFYGTERTPTFSTNAAGTALEPRHSLLHQTGLDVQVTGGGFIGKLESVFRGTKNYASTYFASTLGGEYTFSNIFLSSFDFGILLEYLYDSRGKMATAVGEDDIFMGLRLSLNDNSNSSILCGVIVDRDGGDSLGIVKASRRLSETWKVSLRGSYIHTSNSSDPLYIYRKESFLQLELTRFFLP